MRFFQRIAAFHLTLLNKIPIFVLPKQLKKYEQDTNHLQFKIRTHQTLRTMARRSGASGYLRKQKRKRRKTKRL